MKLDVCDHCYRHGRIRIGLPQANGESATCPECMSTTCTECTGTSNGGHPQDVEKLLRPYGRAWTSSPRNPAYREQWARRTPIAKLVLAAIKDGAQTRKEILKRVKCSSWSYDVIVSALAADGKISRSRGKIKLRRVAA